MKKRLTKEKCELYHYRGAKRIPGAHSGMTGDWSRIYGNCSGISGDCTRTSGCVTNIWGTISDLNGCVSNLSGYCSFVCGNGTGIAGCLDDCELIGPTDIKELIDEKDSF